ncbi:hypothetical protein [Cellulomonas soli]|uniref:Uncharacterized protein n=1 Tax=Cellulomonas soli TaxID=931535 RepID=A0A512PEU1_9CELL|nr:hypothetical protein [Cellulomonas soli]NYI59489.1 hypothetical protein [Cellulomonas soli]GEP69719.1 hypothetical protein CSO01_24340 [Cellulomonas soli]
MQTPVERALGAGRLALVSTTALALGVGAHVLGGGGLPGLRVVGALGALLLAATAWTTRVRLRVRLLLPLALAAQAGLHTALTWLTATGTSAGPAATVAAPGGHAHLGTLTLTVTGGGTHLHAAGLTMLVAHLAATMLTVGLLVGTDRAARTVVHLWTVLLPALRAPARTLVERPLRGAAVTRRADRVASTRPIARSQARRGPPVVASAR